MSASLLLLVISTAQAAVTVSVSPTAPSLRVTATQKFTPTINGATDKTVTWYVNDVKGGNATVGTIATDGTYTPPAKPTTPNTVTIKAIPAADTTKSASATVTLQNAVPTLTSLTPNFVNVGKPFTIVLTGTNFLANSTVTVVGMTATVKVDSSTQITITGTGAGTVNTPAAVTVTNPDPGTSTSGSRALSVWNPVAVKLQSVTRTIRGGSSFGNVATVSNHSDKTVKWYVNDILGGNNTLGKIDADGLYQAPLQAPTPNTVTIKAVSVADSAANATAVYTLQNATPILTSAPTSLNVGIQAVTVTGQNFVPNSVVWFGGEALPTTYLSPTQLRVNATTKPVPGSLVAVQVRTPDPGATNSATLAIQLKPKKELVPLATAIRFLSQATWGPDPDSIFHLQEVGISKFLTEQQQAPVSQYYGLPVDAMGNQPGTWQLTRQMGYLALTGQDQLRQRTSWALHHTLVVSGVFAYEARRFYPYMNVLQNGAFGNYRQLLEDITLNPGMGNMLNMLNNQKANPKTGTVANENYAREILQLFSIGLDMLNLDGTKKLDSAGKPIQTYDEATVKEFAKVFTGWVLDNGDWTKPMVPVEARHDTGPKTLLNGFVQPGGKTTREDLEAALDNIFAHPNLAPFVSYRLIQRLVTSNPSPAYIQRVASIFNNNGRGVRGDLYSVVRAILIDSEAGVVKAGPIVTTDPNMTPLLDGKQGRYREPVNFSLNLHRTLNSSPAGPEFNVWVGDENQNVFYPPSVFGYFSPGYRLSAYGVTAPEFQIISAGTAVNRSNWIWSFIYSNTNAVDWTNLAALADNPDLLVAAINNALFGGQLPSAQQAAILKAVKATGGNLTRARIGIYVAAAFTDYLVQR